MNKNFDVLVWMNGVAIGSLIISLLYNFAIWNLIGKINWFTLLISSILLLLNFLVLGYKIWGEKE